MALHNSEQDLIRIKAVLESVASVHPSITNHIVSMQPDFGFKDRDLMALAGTCVCVCVCVKLST